MTPREANEGTVDILAAVAEMIAIYNIHTQEGHTSSLGIMALTHRLSQVPEWQKRYAYKLFAEKVNPAFWLMTQEVNEEKPFDA